MSSKLYLCFIYPQDLNYKYEYLKLFYFIPYIIYVEETTILLGFNFNKKIFVFEIYFS